MRTLSAAQNVTQDGSFWP